jgi:hypothetical protein
MAVTPEKTPGPSRWVGVAMWGFALVCGLTGLSTAVFVLRSRIEAPLMDQWDAFRWFMYVRDNGLRWANLWQQHNEHRIAVPRFIFFLDMAYFGARNIFTTVVLCTAQVAAVLGGLRAISKDPGLERSDKLFLGGSLVVLLLSSIQLLSFVWSFGAQHILVGVFAFLSLSLYARAAVGFRTSSGRPWWMLVASLGACFLAVATSGNGVFLGLLLLVLALALRMPARAIGLIAVCQAGFMAAYFRDYQQPGLHSSPMAALHQLTGLPIRLFLLLGGPWNRQDILLEEPLTRTNVVTAVAAGVVGLVLAAWVARTAWVWRRELRPLEISSVGMALFMGASLLAVSAGRLSFAAIQVLERKYTTTSLDFWAFLIVATGVLLRRQGEKASARSWVLRGAVAACLGIWLIPNHFAQAAVFQRLVLPVREAGLAMAIGVRDREFEGRLHWKPDTVRDVVAFLEQQNLSIFQDEVRQYLGQTLASTGRPIEQGRCTGGLELLEPVPDGPPGDVRVGGWVWDEVDGAAPALVLVVDDAGVVRGGGRVTRDRRDVAKALGRRELVHSGWYGFAKLPQNTARLTAYTLSTHQGRHLCLLGEKTVEPAPSSSP